MTQQQPPKRAHATVRLKGIKMTTRKDGTGLFGLQMDLPGIIAEGHPRIMVEGKAQEGLLLIPLGPDDPRGWALTPDRKGGGRFVAAYKNFHLDEIGATYEKLVTAWKTDRGWCLGAIKPSDFTPRVVTAKPKWLKEQEKLPKPEEGLTPSAGITKETQLSPPPLPPASTEVLPSLRLAVRAINDAVDRGEAEVEIEGQHLMVRELRELR